VPSEKPVIQIRGLSKRYRSGNTELPVLNELDLDVAAGEFVVLFGRSGSGKSTLLNLIAAIDRPDSGRVVVAGVDLAGLGEPGATLFRRRHIGFIFQSFNLIPTLNCAENACVPLLIQGMPFGRAVKKAREMLDRVGLADRWKHRPAQLSGGQQQRVAIARALVHEPRLVICDEPTASLDAHNGHMVMDLFHDVARRPGRAVIIVTHDNRIFKYADRIAQMDDGRIVEMHDVDSSAPPVIHH
jgi:putative ABC transport system ATP-binding protein